MVKFVSDIESDEYELSPKWFEKLKIFTQGEKDKLPRLVMDTVYAFKNQKIEDLIHEIQNKIEKLDPSEEEQLTDLMSEQMHLENVKKVISQKLGRIILK